MGRYRSLDKMTFAVPFVTSKSHYPGKTDYAQTSKSHYYVKKMFYDCEKEMKVTSSLILYLRDNNLKFGRECFCLLSTLRALNEI